MTTLQKAQDLFLQAVRQFTEFGAKASEVADQLFQTLVGLGLESTEDLKVSVAKNKGKTSKLSVEFLGRLQETICRQKFPKEFHHGVHEKGRSPTNWRG